MTPWLTWNPVEYRSAASFFTNWASFSSQARWMSSVPFRNREPAHPVPYFRIAAMAASLTFG